MSAKRMATVREAATALGWSEATVRRACAEKRIPHIRNGSRGSIRIPHAWLDQALVGAIGPDT